MRQQLFPTLVVAGLAGIWIVVGGCGGGASRSGTGGRSGSNGAAAAGGSAGSGTRTGGVPGAGGGAGESGASGGSVGEGGTSGTGVGGTLASGGAGGGPASGGAGGRAGGAGGGAAAGRGGAGGATGVGGAAGAIAACSEMPIRSAPIAGKEAFRYDPVDARFPFSGHWMGVFSANPLRIGDVSMADFDRDGDLDFATGQRQDTAGGGHMMWWEYCAPDHWVPHVIGIGHTSWAGGGAADFDGDGWIDVIAGNSWYRNPQNPRTSMWQRYLTGGPNPEEIIVGDVTGDMKPDALYVHQSFVPQYWSPGAVATATWIKGPNLANAQQQGGAIGDIDGDGDNDILVGYRWWYRNVDGTGSQWQTVEIFPSGFDNAPLTALGDLDGDGDLDFVTCTHFGARIAWAQNQNGVGTQFALNMISTNKSFLHTIWASDFDNDGDLDILAGQNVGPMFIFENTDGRGTFVEHTIATNTRGHEAKVGDVDCDGDLDIASKPWGDPAEGGEQAMPPRDHIYLQNMLVEMGGTPVFNRRPHEVYEAALARVCKEP